MLASIYYCDVTKNRRVEKKRSYFVSFEHDARLAVIVTVIVLPVALGSQVGEIEATHLILVAISLVQVLAVDVILALLIVVFVICGC